MHGFPCRAEAEALPLRGKREPVEAFQKLGSARGLRRRGFGLAAAEWKRIVAPLAGASQPRSKLKNDLLAGEYVGLVRDPPSALPGAGTGPAVCLAASRVLLEPLAGVCRAQLPSWSLHSWNQARPAFAALRGRPVDLLVTGLNLEDWDGLDFAVSVTRARLAARLIVLLDRKTERSFEFLGRLDGDLHGVVDLEEADTDVATALRRVVAGRSFRTASVGGLLRRPQLLPDAYSGKLTPAEVRVLAFAGSGLDDKAVGQALAISPQTAHTHRKRIMHKLNLRSHAETMAYAVRKGLVRYSGERVLRPGFDVARMAAEGVGLP